MKFSQKSVIALSRIVVSLLVLGIGVTTNIAPSNAAIVLTITESDPAMKFVYSTADKGGTNGSQGTGSNLNDRVIYRNAGTYGGVSVDVVVTTIDAAAGTITNYDQFGSATTAAGYIDNWMINTNSAYNRFRYEFYQGGTYKGLNTGIPVILQNLKVTSIDIDTSGTGANQFSDFTGFQKYSMMNPTNLAVIAQPVVAGQPNSVRFIANLAGSRSSAPEDQVMVKYDAVQKMEIAFGNLKVATNYFGLVFGGWPGTGTPVEYPNQFNTPPTSTDVTLGVSDSQSAPSLLSLSAFGIYSDADSNPFMQVKIASLPASGSIQKYNGSAWVDITAGTVITTADIEAGKVRYYPANPGANTSLTFYVHDGLDYSTSPYTLTLQTKAATQVITFPNPGTKAPSQTFPSSAITSATGETVTLTSNTPGICSVNNSTGAITTIATGTCSITATQQGNGTYPAATPVTQVFPVSANQTQVITFATPGTKNESTTAFSSGAVTNAQGLFVTLTSADLTICTVNNPGNSIPTIVPKKAGTCVVTASQPGIVGTLDPAVPVTVSFLIVAPGSSSGSSGASLDVHTAGAEAISSAGATLYGLITPAGSSMTYKFCWTRYSSAISAGAINPINGNNNQVMCSTPASVGSAGPNVSVSEAITQYIKDGSARSLSTQKNYYFQVIGYVGSTPHYGEVMSFYLPGSNDDWVRSKTNAVTTSTENTANLSGAFSSTQRSTTQQTYCLTLDPKQVAINYSALGVQNTSLANCKELTSATIIASSLPTNNTESNTAYVVSGLEGGKWYYFQTRAYDSNKKKLAFGRIVAFQTAAKAPIATTLPVTVFESTTAVLPGSAISNGETSTVTFEYSTSSNLSSGVTTVNATPGYVLGKSAVSVAGLTNALAIGTRYYYRIKVVRDSDSATASGSIKSFVLGAPSVSTLAPTNLETDTATTWKVNLNGYLKPQGFLTTPSFCWGISPAVDADGILQTCTNVAVSTIDSTTASGSITQQLTAVPENATYYYQAKALNREYQGSQLWAYGEVKSFTTAFAPDAVTLDPTGVGATFATLNGTVTSIGDTATVSFCLSKSDSRTPDDPTILLGCDYRLLISENVNSELVGSNQSGTKVATGLAKTTTYYYQITANNKMGSAVGEVKSFTTNAGGPIVTTLPSQWDSNTAATIFGSVNSNGSDTNAYFCLSTDSTTVVTDGGESMTVCSKYLSPTGLLVLGTNTANTPQSYAATGLTTAMTYYYQLFGVNARNERSYGAVLSFRLDQPIVVTSSQVDSITTTSATIRGSANKNNYGSPIHSSFCLATSPDLSVSGVLASCDPTGMTFTSITANSATNISESLTELDPGTTYYYQAYVALTSDTTTPIIGGRMYSFKTRSVVTFDANGGSGGPETQTATTSSALRAFAGLGLLPIDTSAVFVKWNTSPDGSGTDYVDSANYDFADNLTLYAIWSDPSSTYSITYDINGGTGTVPTEGNKSAGQTFSANNGSGLNKSGFTFGGWICAGVTYAAGATVTVASANITCIAIWNAVSTPSAPVIKKKLILRWSDPSPINFGTALSGTQLNGATDAPATCVYTPALGTILAPGEYTLTVTCTPVDGTNYEPVTGTVKLTVKKVKGKPRIIWFNPSPITYPTPLSGTQLNAVASVPGKYSYTPAVGVVLNPGKHALNVKFTPDNQEDNESIDANVTIAVLEKTAAPAAPPTKPAEAADTKTASAPSTLITLATSGKTEEIVVRPTEDKAGVVITAPDWSLQLVSSTKFQQNVTDANSRVVIEKGNTVTTSGTGFKPFSQVDVWVYSTPTWLGAVMTDEFGNFTTTLPMPSSLPEGDHTFQAKGMTPDSAPRVATVPITLVTFAAPNKPGSLKFEVYFGMNSPIVTNLEKARIAKIVKSAQSKIASGAKVTVEIDGWVQPNPNPGNIKYLSTHRANNVANVLRALGLKGAYTLRYPGLAKDNIPTARHASVVIRWTKTR